MSDVGLITNGLPPPQARMIHVMYEAFVASRGWPTFQYVATTTWAEDEPEPREVYYALSSAGCVWPPATRERPVFLREDTTVGLTLLGLSCLPEAADDLALFVSIVRFIGERAASWRPSVVTEAEQLRLTRADIVSGLGLPTGADMARQVLLVRDQARDIWTGLNQPDASNEWQITIDVERARPYRRVASLNHLLEVQGAIHKAHSVDPQSLASESPSEITEDNEPDVLIPGDEAQTSGGVPDPGPSAARMTPISSRTIAALAEPFAHGGGPTHSTINLIWTEADASNYLTAEGSKIDRVLGGLRALRDGRHAGVGPVLQPDHEKLRRVAEGLASRLLALQLVAPDAVIEALNPDASSADDSARSQRDAGSPPAGRAVLTAAASEDDQHAKDQRKVMVIYGQDSDAARALFDWLRAVGLRPQEWGQLVQDTGDASPFIGQVLEKAFIEAQAVVALFTPDEHVRLRSELSGAVQEWRVQARPNVLFEAGMAFATHPRRTLLVVLGSQELPSDLAGRHYVRLGTVESLQDLAQRLDRAGCPVDLSGSDWLNTRRFPARSGIPATP